MGGGLLAQRHLGLEDARLFVSEVFKVGWRPGKLAQMPAIRRLVDPSGEMTEEDVVADLLASECALRRAIDSMGANPRSSAARILIGFDEASWGQQLKHRRAKAAKALDLAVETVNRFHQDEILDDLAVAIFRQARFVDSGPCP